MARHDKMVAYSKNESAKKIAQAKNTVDKMKADGIPITPYSVWQLTGLSKGFIYTNQEIVEYIKANRSNERYSKRKYADKVGQLQKNL